MCRACVKCVAVSVLGNIGVVEAGRRSVSVVRIVFQCYKSGSCV